jgi:hypothetical protein
MPIGVEHVGDGTPTVPAWGAVPVPVMPIGVEHED